MTLDDFELRYTDRRTSCCRSLSVVGATFADDFRQSSCVGVEEIRDKARTVQWS